MLTFTAIPCFISKMAPEPKQLLGDLLKATSRSFYLTLRVLTPPELLGDIET